MYSAKILKGFTEQGVRVKGCDSNFEVKCSNSWKSLQMKQLPCIKQYVLG